MQIYCESLTQYRRLKTREVNIGGLLLGNPDGYLVAGKQVPGHPIRVQTMTTTDTMDTLATVEQAIRCIEAGSELVRITAPSKKEAENLLNIKNELRKRGYTTPLVADIHFTPNAAEIAARIVEKVRVNPGNYVDKKKFELIEYSDADYKDEIDRIRDRFAPLIWICKEYGTAMRIGTNHGSLSDRIMSRYGDTPMGMVESAMEFLRIARDESYHNIVLSMKASNPLVMVQAYRLLAHTMFNEFGECYPLHLGVTEAGDGEDGRIKSAVGIGTLMEDGLGDTIRVSLTEDPEFEIPVCRDLVKRYTCGRYKDSESNQENKAVEGSYKNKINLPYSPFGYKRRETFGIADIGGAHVPVVVADLSKIEKISPVHLGSIGYTYDTTTDKWNVSDAAADYVFTGNQVPDFALPVMLKVIINYKAWLPVEDREKYYPIFSSEEFINSVEQSPLINFVMIDCSNEEKNKDSMLLLQNSAEQMYNVVLCLSSTEKDAMQTVRKTLVELGNREIKNPVILVTDSNWQSPDEHLIHFATETGALFLDGFGDGICLGMTGEAYKGASVINASGRNYSNNQSIEQFLNNIAFNILQATRTRISKTEYISCPSCGRTLFDLQETTAKIRSVTNHLKGLKIAIMGCIVNGPGEMADADFGYVGSGVGKVTLYRGKEIVKRNIDNAIAVDELISLLKENDAWMEP